MRQEQIPGSDETEVTTARALVRALRRERQRLGMSCEALDDLAGLPDRYVNKLENFESNNGRGLGFKSVPDIVQALGLRLVLVRKAQPKPKQRRRRRR